MLVGQTADALVLLAKVAREVDHSRQVGSDRIKRVVRRCGVIFSKNLNDVSGLVPVSVPEIRVLGAEL